MFRERLRPAMSAFDAMVPDGLGGLRVSRPFFETFDSVCCCIRCGFLHGDPISFGAALSGCFVAADRHFDHVHPVPDCLFFVFAVVAAQSGFVSGNALTAITAGAAEKRPP